MSGTAEHAATRRGSRNIQSVEDIAQELLDMPNKEFFACVDRDIRDALPPSHAEAMRSNALLVERWYQTLASMKRNVEGTLAAKNAEAKADRIACLQRGDHTGALDVSMKHHKWRSGALRFATGVSEKLTEARYHRLRFYPLLVESAAKVERNRLSQRVDLLLDAIRTHRDELMDDEPSEADEKLWDLLQD